LNIQEYQKVYAEWMEELQEFDKKRNELWKKMPKAPNVVLRHFRQKLRWQYSPVPDRGWDGVETVVVLSHWWSTSGWLMVRRYTLEQFKKLLVSDEILEIPGEVSHKLTKASKAKIKTWADEIGLLE
jgi:hypothetical protein